MTIKSVLSLLLMAGILFGFAARSFADPVVLPSCDNGESLVYKEGRIECSTGSPKCDDGQMVTYNDGKPVCSPKCDDGQMLVYSEGKPVCSPNCENGQTQMYKDGKPICGPACPAYVYANSGPLGMVAFNIPPSNLGEIHPPAGDRGLPTGLTRNTVACTFHMQCSPGGWVAITTGADSCPIGVQDVP